MKEHVVSPHPLPLGEVVLVCTSTVESDGGTPQGCWLADVAHAYQVFSDAGFDVTFSSLKGGQVPCYDVAADDPIVQRFREDKVACQCLNNTVKLDKINTVENYDAFYLAGGTGAMVDFPTSEVLRNILTAAFESGKVIAACGLGVVGLLAIESEGLAGRKVAHCPDLESVGQGVGYPNGAPRSLKDLLINKGLQPLEEEVVTDVNIITARACASSKLAEIVTHTIPKRTVPQPPIILSS